MREASAYAKDEVEKRGIIAPTDSKELKLKLLSDTSDYMSNAKGLWNPTNFIDGEWKMMPVSYD